MTSHYRHRRSDVATDPVPQLETGEIAVNTANRQIAVGGPTGTPVALIAVRYFDARTQYAMNDIVAHDGKLYSALAAIPPGPFTLAQWHLASSDPGDTQDLSNYVQKAGGTMTGTLVLAGLPQADLEAAPKKYIDDAVANIDTGDKVDVAGDVMTGNLSIKATNATFVLNKTSDTGAMNIAGQYNDLTRWLIKIGDNTAESPGNVGSNFTVHRFDNSGSDLGEVLGINRATGLATVTGDPTAPKGIATKKYADDVYAGAVAVANTKVSKSGDTMSGQLTVQGDIYAMRNQTQGIIFLGGNGAHYVYFDGANYSLPNGGLVVGGGVSAGAASFSGAVNANGGMVVPYGQPITINTTGSFASAGPGNFQVQGGVPTISFHYPGYFGANFSMNSDGNFYIGGWSFGENNYFKIMTSRDGTPVTSHRMVYVGDFVHTYFQWGWGVNEPYGRNASVTGIGPPNPQQPYPEISARYAQHQILINGGWVAVGGA